jgi:hypothetical protein
MRFRMGMEPGRINWHDADMCIHGGTVLQESRNISLELNEKHRIASSPLHQHRELCLQHHRTVAEPTIHKPCQQPLVDPSTF